MQRFSILSLLFAALLSSAALGQDIILLNQDGEKVGIAKDVDKKEDDKKAAPETVIKVEPGDKGTSRIENGVVIIVKPDGEVQEFKLSDARSMTVTRSTQSVVGEDGKQKTKMTGKAILIGPDGVRREIDLSGGGLGGATKSKAPKSWMIGVSCSPASPVLRSQLRLEEGTGLVISRVLGGGAAEKAGFKDNDVVMFADQKPIGNRKTLTAVVNEAGAAGTDLIFTLLRGGEEISLTVKPTEREGVSRVMAEMGPDFGRMHLDLPPGFGPGFDMEFKQFGPGIIIRDGAMAPEKLFLGDFEERIQRMREEMEEMRRHMGEDRK